ncbi:MAG TPA: DUF5684 domain-containing protein [Nostocaceae cyanobacterium]|nr:DUF5684 domain-containing protein [Nostocaceae cyanobacterium]
MLLNQDWGLVYLLAQSEQGGSAGLSIANLLFSLFGYIFGSYCMQKIFDKVGEENSWFAWIPILNVWIMYKAGDKSPWWIIGFIIPFVNIVAAVIYIMAFVNVIKKINKNPWLLLLLIIPIVNFVVLYNFAFS